MKKASDLFGAEDRRRIEEAVTTAEKKTSGEIVPVVATSSGRYDRAEDVFGVLFSLVLLSLFWLRYQEITPLSGDWESGAVLGMGLFGTIVTIVIGFILGTVLATKIPELALPFIPKDQMEEEVEKRATEAFKRYRVRGSKNATGILVYVSLYERMVRVEGDDAILEKLQQTDWEEVIRLVTRGLADDRPAEGLIDGIVKCGDVLALHFPREEGDVDELSNELRIMD